jgi:hypothetical protein
MEHGLKIGNIFLEEDNDTSVKAYVGLHQGVPLKKLIKTPRSSRTSSGTPPWPL